MEKAKQWIYYIIIGVVSFIALVFLPMVGTSVGLEWALPSTAAGWVVWIALKLIIAALNVTIFHCFMCQAKINIKDDEKYTKALELLSKTPRAKEYKPLSPEKWTRKQYASKGVGIFITTAFSTVALAQAILTFDWVTMLTYLFTIIFGILFGIMQMKNAEEYWTTDFYNYAVEQAELVASTKKETQKEVHLTPAAYVENINTLLEEKNDNT